MAAAFFSRRSLNLAITQKLRRAIAAARPFSNSAFRRVDESSAMPAAPSEVWPTDPIFPCRALIAQMDEDGPFGAAASMEIAKGYRRDFEDKEDDEGRYIRLDMPGYGKEDVKVWMDVNKLVIRGVATQSEEGEENRRTYCCSFKVHPDLYKTDEIKAEIKNGVLKVVVPKVAAFKVRQSNRRRHINID